MIGRKLTVSVVIFFCMIGIGTAFMIQIMAGTVHAEKKQKDGQQNAKAALQNKLLRASVKITLKDDESTLIVEGFPYRKDITGDYKIEIINVDKGVFTASESSIVPTDMMGMIYGISGGSFVAQCDAEDGTQTLADAVGNSWVFAKSGLSFDVYLPGSKKPTYTLRAKAKGATISFTKEGVLVKGFEFTNIRQR